MSGMFRDASAGNTIAQGSKQDSVGESWSFGSQLRASLAGLVLLTGCATENSSGAHKEPVPVIQNAKDGMRSLALAEVNPNDHSIPQAEYDLSGGSKVVVHKPYGDAVYSAVFTMNNGPYPQAGSEAHNVGRHEMLYVIDGSFTVTLNSVEHSIAQGQNLMICDGDRYILRGNGSCLVVVHDQPGGATVIEPVRDNSR
jgi:hypothetical protein